MERGAGCAGPERGARGQAAEKKSAVLDLSKHVDQRVRVKFTGGREGESLRARPAFGARPCAWRWMSSVRHPRSTPSMRAYRAPRSGGDATRRGGETEDEWRRARGGEMARECALCIMHRRAAAHAGRCVSAGVAVVGDVRVALR